MDIDLSPLWISLKTAIVATGFAFIGGIAAARGMLGYRGRWQGVLDGLLTMPLILPPTVVGFVLLLALGRSSPLGQLLETLDITIIFSWTATVIASTVVAFPLMYKTVLGAFRQVDSDVLDCSRTLGASESRIFWQLLLPLAWPGVLAGTILAFARALGEFGATLMLAGSIPGRTKTMPIAIFFAGEAGHLGEAFFWTVVLGSIALSAIVLINCFSDDALTENKLAESRWAKAIATTLQQWFTILGRYRSEIRPLVINSSRTSTVPADGKKLAPGTWALRDWKGGGLEGRTVSDSENRSNRGKRDTINDINIKGVKTNDVKTGAAVAIATTAVVPQSALAPPVQSVPVQPVQQGLVVELEKELSSVTIAADFTAAHRPLGILGASGAGKSTVLRCVAGLMTPTKGRIVLNGRVLFDSEHGINVSSAKRRVGFVFQNYALFPHMRVARNIGFGLQSLPREERQSRVDYYINLLQLQGLERHYPHQLSGGQQQRVALARVLATNPEVLLLDEPLSALDSYLRDRVEKSLVELFSTYSGAALIVTHNLEEAYRLCDRWLVLSQGKAIAYGRKEDVFERPGNYATAQLTECKNISSATILKDGYIRVLSWNNCILKVTEPLPKNFAYVGIRAHHVGFWPSITDEPPEGDNVFPVWPVFTSETQHRVTLYLHIASDIDLFSPLPPGENGPHVPYHLQAELPKDVWFELKQRMITQANSHLLWVRLDASRLILLADG